MSGSFRRRHSKWDDKDSEALTENFHDSVQTRRPIEPVSPSRGSRRHNSRSKERTMTWDRDENIARTSGPSELRQHDSRSPRNGWGQSYSRSRSRSRSPSHYLRRDPAGHDRSRNRSGVSGKVCRDFVTGRCRRGIGCHFLHQDAQPYDSRQPLDRSPPDDWESRHRGVGGSRYSPADTKDYAPRPEKSMHICSEFLKGKCRRGASCRYEHPDLVDDSFKEDLIDDSHRDRENFQNNRDSYSHRSHDRQPVDDAHRDRDRDNAPRSRDTYSHRNHDREPTDVYEKRPMDDVHRGDRDKSDSRDIYSHRDQENRPADDVQRDRDNALRNRDSYTHRNHDFEPSDMFDKRHVDDAHRDRENLQRSRDTYQNHDRGSAGRFEKGSTGDAYRDRDYDHKVKNVYRNHDREPQKRGGILCKFFASGNCANGNRCRFVHEVQERLSPQRRSKDDKRGPDHKVESNQVWDGPSWSDVATMTNAAPVRGWGEEKNEVKEVIAAKSEDNSRNHDMVNVKETWVMPVDNDGFQKKDEKPQFQWESGNSLSASRGGENVSGDMEISPRDSKQHPLCSSNSHAPSLSNISFASVQPNPVSEGFYEKPYPIEFQDQKVHSEPFTMQNLGHENEKPVVYHGDGINVIPVPNMNGPPQQGFFQVDQNVSIQPTSALIPLSGHVMSPTLNVPPRQDLFQIDQTISAQPSSGSSLPTSQGLAQFAAETSDGNRMQQLSNNPPSFLNSVVTDGPHLVNAATSASLNIVSDEQLVQLSNLSASLAQLLENRQQLPQLSTATTILPDMPNHRASETSKQQYDPICDSVEPKIQKSSHEAEQITDNMVQDKEGGGMMKQEPLITSEDDEKVKKIAEGNSKEPENKPSEDVPVDDADDGNKGKDSKAIRPFKFALAEFVKELLKPSWKDGQINKDAYKTIVKKVVDKIIETQGPQIPHTKEKIDLYLSCSKPKIEKLVQAYVGKFQKNQT